MDHISKEAKAMAEDMMKISESPAMKEIMKMHREGMPCPCGSKGTETFAEISRKGLESLRNDKTFGDMMFTDCDKEKDGFE
jgi:hypothetical protein